MINNTKEDIIMDKVYVVKRSESDIIYAGTDKKAAEDISQRLDNDQEVVT